MTKKLPTESPAVRTADTSLVGVSLYHGPLPPAAEFAAYEQSYPGAANRILALAEADQKATFEERRFQQRSDFTLDMLLQMFFYGLVASAVYLAMNDKPLEALFAGLGPVLIAIYANTHKRTPKDHG
jgi:uncharacterized membrane protein